MKDLGLRRRDDISFQSVVKVARVTKAAKVVILVASVPRMILLRKTLRGKRVARKVEARKVVVRKEAGDSQFLIGVLCMI